MSFPLAGVVDRIRLRSCQVCPTRMAEPGKALCAVCDGQIAALRADLEQMGDG